MQPWWKQESELARYMDNQRGFRSARTPVTPTYPGALGHVHEEDLIRLDRMYGTLQNILQRFPLSQEHYQRISDLLVFVQRLRNEIPAQTPDIAFDRLQPLRTWLFWLPPAMLRGSEMDLGALAVLSLYFGVALALEPLSPEIGGSYLASMAATPIEEVRRIVHARKASEPYSHDVQIACSMIELPCEILNEYRHQQQWSSPRASFDAYSSGSHSPYHAVSNAHLQATSPSSTSGYSAYTTSPLHSPLTPAIVTSPYQYPTMVDDSRRPSHIMASPTLHSDPADEKPVSIGYKHSSHDHSAGMLNPAYLGNLINGGPVMGAEYHDSTINMTGGLVSPELWT